MTTTCRNPTPLSPLVVQAVESLESDEDDADDEGRTKTPPPVLPSPPPR